MYLSLIMGVYDSLDKFYKKDEMKVLWLQVLLYAYHVDLWYDV